MAPDPPQGWINFKPRTGGVGVCGIASLPMQGEFLALVTQD